VLETKANRHCAHHRDVELVTFLESMPRSASRREERDGQLNEHTWKKSSIVLLNPGASDSCGHLFCQTVFQSLPISIVSFASGACTRSFAISSASVDCVTRSRPCATYPRLERGSSHASLSYRVVQYARAKRIEDDVLHTLTAAGRLKNCSLWS
jgi:hypothetical protein